MRYFRGITGISVSATTDFQVVDPTDSKTLVSGTPDSTVSLKPSEEGIVLTLPDGTTTTSAHAVEISPASPDGIIQIGSARKPCIRYRGVIEVRARKTHLDLVNRIDLEDYLLSVVPSEMPSQFQPEALKAQAVAARTYAVVTKGKHKDLGYDLCDEVNCQAYTGANGEKPAATQAVKDTSGTIMTSNGKPIYAQFCADCGGRTKAADQPYLKSVADKPDDNSPDYCSAGRFHTWSISCTPGKLEPLLSRTLAGSISGLKSLSVKATDESGRVGELEAVDSLGSHIIPGRDVRRAIGVSVLKSEMFTVAANEDGSFTIQGKGFGHGVGMCQWGANGMASPPYSCTFDQILKHYYSGIELTRLQS